MARFPDKNGVVATKGFFQEVPNLSGNANSIVNAFRHGVSQEAVVTVNWNDGAAAGTAYTVNVPAGAIITSVSILPVTTFNSGTLNQVKVGSTVGGTDILGLTTLNTGSSNVSGAAAAVEAARAGASPVPAAGTVYLTTNYTGTTITAGKGYVIVRYTVPAAAITNANL